MKTYFSTRKDCKWMQWKFKTFVLVSLNNNNNKKIENSNDLRSQGGKAKGRREPFSQRYEGP